MTDFFTEINIKNAIIANNSVVLKNWSVVKQSIVNEVAYKKYKKIKFLLKYIFPTLNFSSKKDYILITDEWSKNYCHWLWEALTKLLILQKNHPQATLVLPKSYLKIDFVKNSLEVFGIYPKDLIFINKKSHLKVVNLNFIPCINIATLGYYDFLEFSLLRDRIISHFENELKLDFGEKIYISRSDPKKNTVRKVANEAELEMLLVKYGFKTVYMENYSFLEQISIANKAKIIISPHGAGITNTMFMSENGILFELVNKEWSKTCFAEMVERMNIKYLRQDCEAINQKETIHLVDIIVDIKKLEENLMKLI